MSATSSISIRSYSYKEVRTYVVALLFVAGNVLLPQLCHLLEGGGLIFLPIYFFTLIGACKYGWRVGVLTAVLSPLVNNLLFGMPPVAMLPVIEVKSIVLACVAGLVVARYGRINLLIMAVIVFGYQLLGGVAEWIISGSLWTALQDVRIGIPGLLLQIFGGYAVLRYLLKD